MDVVSRAKNSRVLYDAIRRNKALYGALRRRLERLRDAPLGERMEFTRRRLDTVLACARKTVHGRAIGATVPAVDVVAQRYLGDADGRIGDPVLRDAVARHVMDDHAFQLTLRRAAEESEAGAANGGLSSMFKYYGTEQNKRKFELILKCAGHAVLGWEGEGFDEPALLACRTWLRSKGNSIEGGTSEIQLNVIAKRVLGLPD